MKRWRKGRIQETVKNRGNGMTGSFIHSLVGRTSDDIDRSKRGIGYVL
jgi:hypothetical protein